MDPIRAQLDELIRTEGLPDSINVAIEDIYVPVARELAEDFAKGAGKVRLVGLNGCQGSGKSTLAKFLRLLLKQRYRMELVVLSLDDYYLTRQQRKLLADSVHPLLLTRGVPGTHDVALLQKTLDRLYRVGKDTITCMPTFDKGSDDRLPESQWQSYVGRADIILLEGWCIGAGAQSRQALQTPVNDLERREDPKCIWRSYVNEQLRNIYSVIFSQLEFLVMLHAPGFEVVFDWRRQQEQKLRARANNPNAGMSDIELRTFVQHFERLTTHMLQSLPARADIVVELRADRSVGRFLSRQQTL